MWWPGLACGPLYLSTTGPSCLVLQNRMGVTVQSRDLHGATAPCIYLYISSIYIYSSRGGQHVTKHLPARLLPKVVSSVAEVSIIERRLKLMTAKGQSCPTSSDHPVQCTAMGCSSQVSPNYYWQTKLPQTLQSHLLSHYWRILVSCILTSTRWSRVLVRCSTLTHLVSVAQPNSVVGNSTCCVQSR